MSVKIDIKWGKELLKDLEIDYSQPPEVFKMQIFSLTGVPVERQKIMVKGGMLKDDSDWAKLGLKNGQKIMMMGTAEVIVAPEKEIQFVEDLPEAAQEAASTAQYGSGLANLQNTCYMNSTLQCLYNITDLKEKILSFDPAVAINPAHNKLTVAAKGVFQQLGNSMGVAVDPYMFLAALREKYPRFAETGQNGVYSQQDAEECYSQLMYSFREALQGASGEDPVKDILGSELVLRLKCEESGEEYTERQLVYSLKCNITQQVDHLQQGMKIGLQEDREKNSESLGRLSLFKGEAKVSKLPKFQTVQFVRFFWKTNISIADGTTGVKSKILRKVSYPLILDMYDYCDDDLKAELDVARQAMKEADDAKVLGKRKEGEAGSSNDGDVVMAEGSENQPTPTPTRLTGHYDLVGLLTHKGRSADSGHYISYIKRAEKGDWISYDDDKPPAVQNEEDILKLSGGGDWHMAYLLVYKARLA
ncbi:deubiquitinating enzyme [Cymbomonas tetramitiformis]|uniref:ubiquitinyl hydrolase 1 n=1 Tax=Cymbomonas tetramitiformis TaxID=36881 RepID=A0AAE0GSX2_9CHLO|nr:deubiquitinating enzyme [Cymbomonas tetramitiformis]